MKKLLVILSILAFIFVAVPVQADWLYDIIPLHKDIIHLEVKSTGNVMIVKLKAKDGFCEEYKVVNNEVLGTRKCGSIGWKDFIKK